MRGEHGQATVEFLGIVPAVLAVGLVAWQLVLVGHAAWLAARAARSGARAALVGDDAVAAARSALPAALERGLRVERAGDVVRARVRVPLLVPGWDSGVALSASASLEARP